jgi:thiamine pyrophosphate-dependent acetolactate synthase large subunit-like protein
MEDAFQGLDQQSLFKPITKKTWTVTDVKQIPITFSNAFKLTMSPRRGPVCINLPRNILATSSKFNINQYKKSYEDQSSAQGKTNDIKKAVKIINNSKKTVIIAGGGIKYTGKHKDVIKLAELLNIPMVTAAGHGDAIPFNHKLNAGQMGPRGNPVASKLVKEADVIIALGTRLGFNSTFYSYDNINKKTKIIQVELEKKMLGRYFPISIGIHADAANAANQIYNEIKKQKTILDVKNWTNSYLKKREKFLIDRDKVNLKKQFPIQPQGLFKQLRSVIPKNSAITLDAGTLCLQATDALEYYDPPSLFTPLDFGLVGFSFACGLGVKVAKPKKTVVSLMGDGGFGMTISELSTAVDYGINTITIVMNNKSWGAEKAYQKDFFGKRYLGADISSPQFDKVAELYGAKGFKVNKISEINEAVKAALKCNKPAVIDVDVDPKALYSFRKDSFKHKIK